MKWSEKLDKRLIELFELGKTNSEIGIELSLTEGSIRNRCRRLELKRVHTREVICKTCGLGFVCNKSDKRIFCSNSCANSFSNRNRTHTEETKNKIGETLRGKPKKIKLKVDRICRNCDQIVLGRKIICDDCKIAYYKFYRPLCEFDFNPLDYPEKFDLSLIKERGKYSPKNKGDNMAGVSRDHMYSVYDGYINKIDPTIIRHPANCQLLIHKENNKKKTNSSITLELLLERIKNW